MKAKIRITAGLLLILSALPPLSLLVFNVFVLLPAAVGLIIIFLPDILKNIKKLTKARYKTAIRVISVFLAAAAVFFAGEFILILVNSRPESAPENSVLIVPGAQVDGKAPSLILFGRITAASGYLRTHPYSLCIASGGRGKDEDESEAVCIKDGLVKDGINPERIFTEDKSKNTKQNFENAAKIISAKGLSRNVALATDGFHMLRAEMIAKREGLYPYSCPARTDMRLAPTFYIRELFALPKSILIDR